MFQLVNGSRGVADEVFDRVLVAEPVGALDGIVHVPLPAVLGHVSERGGDTALRRHRVGAGGENLGDARSAQAGLRGAERCAEAGAAGADHDHVVGMINPVIAAHFICLFFAYLNQQSRSEPPPWPRR